MKTKLLTALVCCILFCACDYSNNDNFYYLHAKFMTYTDSCLAYQGRGNKDSTLYYLGKLSACLEMEERFLK